MSEHDWSIEDDSEGWRGGPTHYVTFSDEIAHEREDMVVRAVEFLSRLEGVVDADHVDREMIDVTSPGKSRAELETEFAAWWKAAMKEKPQWATAMDRLATDVFAELKPLGFRKKKWVFNRKVSDEVLHVVELMHYFGDEDEPSHEVRVAAGVYLPMVESAFEDEYKVPGSLDEPACTIRRRGGNVPMNGDSAAVLKLVRQEIDQLSRLETVDQVTAAWDAGVNIGWGRHPSLCQALIAFNRGNIAVSSAFFQDYFDYLQPRQRNYLRQVMARVSAPPVTTGSNPNLSVVEEDALARWKAAVPGLAQELTTLLDVERQQVRWLRRLVSSKPSSLDGSLASTPLMWRLLTEHQEAALQCLREAVPITPHSFLGHGTMHDVKAGRLALANAMHCLTERVTAYVATAIVREVPGAKWGIDHDGSLCLTERGNAAVLPRVLSELRIISGDTAVLRVSERSAYDFAHWVKGGRGTQPAFTPNW